MFVHKKSSEEDDLYTITEKENTTLGDLIGTLTTSGGDIEALIELAYDTFAKGKSEKQCSIIFI
ncbi:TPA: hypothetical protein ACTW0G_001343 [Raoultella planticola]